MTTSRDLKLARAVGRPSVRDALAGGWTGGPLGPPSSATTHCASRLQRFPSMPLTHFAHDDVVEMIHSFGGYLANLLHTVSDVEAQQCHQLSEQRKFQGGLKRKREPLLQK